MHVIDILADGSAQAMHKDSFDLSFLGRQSITRATEIKFNEDTQKWDILLPSECTCGCNAVNGWFPVDGSTGFDTYEGARLVEVAWLNACRVEGVAPGSLYGLCVLDRIKLCEIPLED